MASVVTPVLVRKIYTAYAILIPLIGFIAFAFMLTGPAPSEANLLLFFSLMVQYLISIRLCTIVDAVGYREDSLILKALFFNSPVAVKIAGLMPFKENRIEGDRLVLRTSFGNNLHIAFSNPEFLATLPDEIRPKLNPELTEKDKVGRSTLRIHAEIPILVLKAGLICIVPYCMLVLAQDMFSINYASKLGLLLGGLMLFELLLSLLGKGFFVRFISIYFPSFKLLTVLRFFLGVTGVLIVALSMQARP